MKRVGGVTCLSACLFVCSANKMIGNLLESFSWFPAITLMNILGLNRLLKFAADKWADRLFSKRKTWVRSPTASLNDNCSSAN